jgi:TfoX/Sxy family transcriptional regulator of competence genes
MFGCPAIYVGRKMAACVLHNEVGLRVPAQVADAARSSGRARPFTPYGKHPMREWIALDLPADRLHLAHDLLEAAMRFASENDAKT